MTVSNDDNGKPLHPESRAAQALGRIDAVTRALVPPLHPSTTYIRDADGGYRSGRGYTRSQNPTYDTPEDLLANLDGGASCLLFASGMAASTAVFQTLLPGDHVIVPRIMYWAMRKWLHEFAMSWGLDVEMADTSNTGAIRAALRPGKTRLLWLETPANPTWEISDIAAAADLAHSINARLAVDNTVATPVLTRPIEFGADLVIYSATKYLNGHSDVLAGAVVTARRDAFWQRLHHWQQDAGGVLGPFEAWLLLRGMRTLYPRVRQSSRTAQSIAERLSGHPRISAVLYPGLLDHPQHALATRQMTDGFGGMLSIRLEGGKAAAMATAARVELFKRATSLGGVESLIEHRASIEGPATPVPDDLLRLSIGLEHADDLIADLEHGLDYTDHESTIVVTDSQGQQFFDDDGLSARIAAVVATHIRPVVQDRGGDLHASLANGSVAIDVLGSPGALVPLRSWITGMLRHHVPTVTNITFAIEPSASPSADVNTPVAQRVEELLSAQINPAIAAHGGKIELDEVRDGAVYVRFSGRCQGCTMAEVTLRQGVETLLREHIDGVQSIVDRTDHDAGLDPFFSPGKGGGADG